MGLKTCSIKWCRDTVPYGRFICVNHYRRIPEEIKKRMRSFGIRYGEQSHAYQMALRDAIDSVERQEKEGKLPPPSYSEDFPRGKDRSFRDD